MASYKVIGDRLVAGKNTGEFLSDEELDGVNIPALIEGGHLESPKAAKAEKKESE